MNRREEKKAKGFEHTEEDWGKKKKAEEEVKHTQKSGKRKKKRKEKQREHRSFVVKNSSGYGFNFKSVWSFFLHFVRTKKKRVNNVFLRVLLFRVPFINKKKDGKWM